MRCIGVLLLLLLRLPETPAEAQVSRMQTAQQRLDSLMLDQATRVLERYGDMFYVLGFYLASDGEVRGVSPRHWAALSAPPDEWLDSLLAGFQDYLPAVRAAAYAVDLWRQLDSTRAESTYAVFHFETGNGACLETRRRYDWSSDGSLVWTKPDTLTCHLRIWRGRAGLPEP
jgi:hypothetical protein